MKGLRIILPIILVSMNVFSQVDQKLDIIIPDRGHRTTINDLNRISVFENYAIPVSSIDQGFFLEQCGSEKDLEKAKKCTLNEISKFLRSGLEKELTKIVPDDSVVVVFVNLIFDKFGNIIYNGDKSFVEDKVIEKHLSMLITEKLKLLVGSLPKIEPGRKNNEPKNVRAEIRINV